jgi:hypothetical protein
MTCRQLGFWFLACGGIASPAMTANPRNLIVFVPDGLRAAIVDASTAHLAIEV